MLKKIIYFFLFNLLFYGCQKDDNIIKELEEPIIEEPVPILNKKGVAYSYNTTAWSHKTHDLGGHWFYHWGSTPRVEIPDNVEYVPMMWGKSSVTDESIARLKQLKAEGKIKYILGFNEPDGEEQANMTVDEAIALWPRLEEVGVPLVSPSPVGTENPWLIEFMEKAEALNLRVDYIGFHSYGGASSDNFIDRLNRTYNRWGKPIWITEFAVADWTATTAEENKYSEEQILVFMKRVLPVLDNIEWVFRYSWFDGLGRAPLASSALFDNDNNLTKIGRFYANHNPNFEIGPGTDTDYVPPADEDEMIVNGHFEGGTYIHDTSWEVWSNFPNGWDGYRVSTVGITTTEAHTGNVSVSLRNDTAAIEQIITVTPETTYTIKIFTQWEAPTEVDATALYIAVKNNADNTKIVNPSFSVQVPEDRGEWKESVFEFTTPASVTEIKINFYNGGARMFLDDISLKEKK